MANQEKSPVEVSVKDPGKAASLASEEPFIHLRTGLTEGKTYQITIRPRVGKPVLIAVHL